MNGYVQINSWWVYNISEILYMDRVMEQQDFELVLAKITELDEKQRNLLQDRLNHLNDHDVLHQIESLHDKTCPHCQSSHVIKWGKQCGLQRYKCHDCKKTYNAITNTPMARVRDRTMWLAYCQSMSETDESLRKVAARLGISLDKSFRWRHKLLKQASDNKPQDIKGIVESDETYFPLSYKGQKNIPRQAHKRGKSINQRGLSKEQVAVLIVRNRSGLTTDFKIKKVNTNTITASLQNVLAEDAILCTDGAPVYKAVTKALNLCHEAVNLSRGIRVNGAFHVQNVNAYDSRLKNWMSRFHGVATKYLQNYLGWRRILDQWKQKLDATSFLQIALGRMSPHQLLT